MAAIRTASPRVMPKSKGSRPCRSFTVCTAEPGPLRTTAGFTIAVEYGLEALAEAGLIIVPSWRDPAEAPPADTSPEELSIKERMRRSTYPGRSGDIVIAFKPDLVPATALRGTRFVGAPIASSRPRSGTYSPNGTRDRKSVV